MYCWRVTSRSHAAPALLRLASHPLRWRLLIELARSDLRVHELVTLTGQPQNLVSYHLRLLRDGGLVTARRSSLDGRDSYHHLDLGRCADALAGTGAALHPALHLSGTAGAPSGRLLVCLLKLLIQRMKVLSEPLVKLATPLKIIAKKLERLEFGAAQAQVAAATQQVELAKGQVSAAAAEVTKAQQAAAAQVELAKAQVVAASQQKDLAEAAAVRSQQTFTELSKTITGFTNTLTAMEKTITSADAQVKQLSQQYTTELRDKIIVP